MPEGPEVKLFVDNLNHNYRYYMIKSVNVLSGRYLKKPIENLDSLLGKEIQSFNCKGKFLKVADETSRNLVQRELFKEMGSDARKTEDGGFRVHKSRSIETILTIFQVSQLSNL